MFNTNFTPLDWLILFLYLGGIALVGLYVNRHVHDKDDYLVGGRGAGTALSVASFIGTGLGLVTVVYASIEGFTKGFSYLAIAFLDLLGAFIFGVTGFVISRLRRMELTTITEFFERRFHPSVRVVAGAICALAGILNMGLFPRMGATFLVYAAGLGAQTEQAAFTINLMSTFLILLVLVYTVSGGMVAIIVTDYLQFVLLSLGLGLGLLWCFRAPEISWDKMVGALVDHKGELAFNPFAEGSYGWIYFLWQWLLVFTAALCWAPEASRALTTQDEETTRRTFYFGSSGFFARLALPTFWGVAAFCFVMSVPEMAEYFNAKNLEAAPGRASEAVPLMMGKLLPTGFLGLVIAGLMAAHMSVHDSYLLAWATVLSQDVIAPLRRKKPLTDDQSILITRIFVVLIAVFLLIWGVWYPLPESVWTYMSITGTVYLAGASTALVGGMYWRRASSTGAIFSLLGGLFALLALGPVRDTILRMASPGLDAPGLAELRARTAGWFNEQTVGLGVYGVCLVLFVVGSLLFPDARVGDMGAMKETKA